MEPFNANHEAMPRGRRVVKVGKEELHTSNLAVLGALIHDAVLRARRVVTETQEEKSDEGNTTVTTGTASSGGLTVSLRETRSAYNDPSLNVTVSDGEITVAFEKSEDYYVEQYVKRLTISKNDDPNASRSVVLEEQPVVDFAQVQLIDGSAPSGDATRISYDETIDAEVGTLIDVALVLLERL